MGLEGREHRSKSCQMASISNYTGDPSCSREKGQKIGRDRGIINI